ncbi:MAG: Gfo/Idh/MocA family oxidoreductase [Maribacter sp.]
MLKNKKIRWGIIGLGRIARLFAEDLKLIAEAELVAVASTNATRADDFAREFHVSQAYAFYAELFNDSTIDVIYVATLHNTHCEFSIEAMNHRKHVLCEKPVAINTSQANEMVNISTEKKVFFMEAFWTRYNPSILQIQEFISQGVIGKLRYINAEFTFYKLEDNPNSRSLNVDLAGGSLLDMGVYAIFLSYLLLGIPEEILARSQFFKTGAEIQTSIIFQYENAQAIIYSGFANNTDMKAKICGEAGEIYIHPFWFEAQGFELSKMASLNFMIYLPWEKVLHMKF